MADSEFVLQKPTEDEVYTTRPNRKPDQAIRGKLEMWREEGQYAFSANRERPEMKREVIHEKNGVKLARTQGDKENSYILTAKCSGEVADPEGTLLSKVVEQLKSRTKKTPQIPNANFIVDEGENLKIWSRKSDKKLCVFLTLDSSKAKELIFTDMNDLSTKIFKAIAQLK